MLTPLLAALPQPLPQTDTLKKYEVQLAQEQGLGLYQLMERAGSAAFQLLRQLWPDARRLLVLAGTGNNGGDAYVLARLAKAQGLAVTLVASGQSKAEEAQRASQAWQQAGGQVHFSLPQPLDADLVVDGLLGMGLGSPVRGSLVPLQAFLGQTSLPILALDIPSGLGSDTGHWWGQPFQAAALVTFIVPKIGLLTGQGRGAWQQAWLAPLADRGPLDNCCLGLDFAALKGLLPRRSATAHKGQSGRLLLVGGNRGMSGAIRMAGEAALRSGAGLVSVQTHPDSAVAVSIGRPELMVRGERHWQVPAISQALVLGPGLGQDGWARQMLDKGLAQPGPKVLDADALNLLALSPHPVPDAVLTPHPGEAARLLGMSVAEVEADRPAAALALARRYQGVAVLKGAGTLVAEGDRLWLLAVGGPAMATGGMGDLLSGIIGALLAQGLGPRQAALLGVALHGEAGERAGLEGPVGTLASDLFPWIRTLINA
ncbi:bifunctional ADP-dependent NAD(P)H-hydrate dehydratase/NAD(P)H-hydrate epimerase [Gallaecimonas xiamenensis]|uniref:Bifunctional NAD(P)H-hydrate repair enzyme n=1 Tax=Gallaecimonas xiamenensis 3-C-1 TaxID=745411 RepID=K2JBA6_9GAMM|nr:bifunctional ADP-dependent NAD(P)H-hydrate dehydratase/NAD(P)H-hydrate epimerase [Gallaecimonas xiamenensis]EKE67864.1 putative carbohydrate kinase [Gallaecimonas xiamenensis 3-C-1]